MLMTTHLLLVLEGRPVAQLVYKTSDLSSHLKPHLQLASPPQVLLVSTVQLPFTVLLFLCIPMKHSPEAVAVSEHRVLAVVISDMPWMDASVPPVDMAAQAADAFA